MKRTATTVALALLVALPAISSAAPYDWIFKLTDSSDTGDLTLKVPRNATSVPAVIGYDPLVDRGDPTTYYFGQGFNVTSTSTYAGPMRLITLDNISTDAIPAWTDAFAAKEDAATHGADFLDLQNQIWELETGTNLNYIGFLIGNQTGTSTTMLAGNASSTSAGFVTSAERAKLVAMSTSTAQVQADWAQSSTTDPSYIQNKPALAAVATTGDYYSLSNRPATSSPSVAYPSRSLNSCFQVSSTNAALVTYSVDIAATISVATGQSGTVFLEVFDNSGCTTGTQEVARFVNGNTGTLAVGFNLTQNVTGTLTGYIPAGKYVKLRTANNSGTPTFTYRTAQEVTMPNA